MDATEPDLVQPSRARRAAHATSNPRRSAPAPRVLNAYSLVNSQAIYEGQRARGARPARLHPHALGVRRACSATPPPCGPATSPRRGRRCGSRFPRASASRSPACRTGPWTPAASRRTAALRPAAGDADDADEWQELNARWFQFSTFMPAPARARPVAEPRDVVPGRRVDPAYQAELEVRPPALPAAALHLLARGRRHA